MNNISHDSVVSMMDGKGIDYGVLGSILIDSCISEFNIATCLVDYIYDELVGLGITNIFIYTSSHLMDLILFNPIDIFDVASGSLVIREFNGG